MQNSLFATKPIASAVSPRKHQALQKTLSAFDLTLLGVGAILGTGIFVVTGRAAAEHAGPAVAVSFLLGGMAAALAALCYAEMVSAMPVAGSTYSYVYATMGELPAFMIGWCLMLEYTVAAALVSVGWSGYVVAFATDVLKIQLPTQWTHGPILWNPTQQAFEASGGWINLPAVVLCGAITWCVGHGVRKSALFNRVVVAFKFVSIFLFVGFAIPYIKLDNWVPFLPQNTGTFGHFGISGLLQGATVVYLSYTGFDAICAVAQETKRPQRDIPLGILLPVGICTVVYTLVACVLTGLVHYTQLSVAHPLALGIAVTGMKWLETLVIAGAIIGLSSNILSMLLAQPRIFMAMGNDGLLPSFLGTIHPKYGTPYHSTLLTGGLVMLLGALLPIDILGELTSVGTLLAFMFVSISVTFLRLQRPELPRKFKLPGGPYVIPLASALISGGLMYTATTSTILRLLGWMVLGGWVYRCYSMRHSHLRQSQHAAVARSSGLKPSQSV